MLKRIILVEQDIQNLLSLQDVLEDAGYLVSGIRDGATALELARGTKTDMIISDEDIPGINGLTLCRIIKDDPSTAHIGVILLTGSLKKKQTHVKSPDRCADDHIVKPVSKDTLLLSVTAVFKKGAKDTRSE